MAACTCGRCTGRITARSAPTGRLRSAQPHPRRTPPAAGARRGLREDAGDCAMLDATAGLGRDGYTLARSGAQVTLVERHPLIAALLRDARAARGEDVERGRSARIEIVEGDAQARTRRGGATSDASTSTRCTRTRRRPRCRHKEMQFFRELTGGDPDADALLAPALACARLRAWRSSARSRAAALAGREPAFTHRCRARPLRRLHPGSDARSDQCAGDNADPGAADHATAAPVN